MSDQSPPPLIFVVCLSLLLLVAFPQVSHSQLGNVSAAFDGAKDSPLRGTSATGHLEQMTGQKIGRFQSRGVSSTPMGNISGMGGVIGMMMLESIMSEALNASVATPQQATQRAELEAWMKAEKQRLTDMVRQQRVQCEMEDKVSIEELRGAMSIQTNGDQTSSDLASALSDPKAVIHNPGGTPFFGSGGGSVSMGAFAVDAVKPPVDLRGNLADKPLTVKNLKQVPDNPFESPVARKLREKIKESQDVRKLYQRQRKLEDQLATLQQLSKDLQSRSQVTMKEFNDYEKWLVSVSGQTIGEGARIALYSLWDLFMGNSKATKIITQSAGQYALDKWTNLRNNPIEYEKTLKAMDSISEAVLMDSDMIEYAVSEKKLLDAIDLIGNNLPVIKNYEINTFTRIPCSSWYTLSKTLIKAGYDLKKEYEIWKKATNLENPNAYNGDLKLGKAYWEGQKTINQPLQKAIKALQENREQLVKRSDIPPESFQELPRIGLGSKVSPLPASK